MKLSIIIPHFNRPSLLEKLFNSIEFNDETQVIVIDDNSTDYLDEYIELKEKYKDRVEFYINNSNYKGAGAARNIGLEKAIGDWLLFADSDDYLIEGYYKVISKYFESKNDIVYFCPKSIKIPNEVPSHRHIRYKNMIDHYHDTNQDLFIRARFVVPVSKLIRRNLIISNNIRFETIMVSNDVMFSVKSGLLASNVSGSKESIYMITDSLHSLTKSKSYQDKKTRIKTYFEYYRYLKDHLSKKDLKQLNISWIIYLKDLIKGDYKFIDRIILILYLFKLRFITYKTG